MVRLRKYAAGGPKDCLIEERDGSVMESTVKASVNGEKTRPKRKIHPPSLVTTADRTAQDYINQLVAQKLREGWQIVGDDDETAAERLHLTLKGPAGATASEHVCKVLRSFGIPWSADQAMANLRSMEFVFEGVTIATTPNGPDDMLTAVSGKASAPALALLFLCLSLHMSQGALGDGTIVDLMQYVRRARDAGQLRQELLDVAYALNVLAPPLDLSALAKPNGRRSMFHVSM